MAELQGQTAAALPRAVLMLGIGGMGMAPLALYLAQAGVRIFGSDDGMQPRVRRLLEAAGVVLLDADAVATGFANTDFEGVELCAISSAIAPSHRLLALARSAGLRVVRRGELLAEVSRTRKLVAIVGSHGKTTTTGLLIAALNRLGQPFDYVLGGLFQGTGHAPARYQPQSDWLVAEVDESDGTIENFSPFLTLAVNFDWDHTDRYASATALRETFAALFTRTESQVIFPADDPVLPALVPAAKALPCEIGAEAKMRGFNGYNEALARAAVRTLLGSEAGKNLSVKSAGETQQGGAIRGNAAQAQGTATALAPDVSLADSPSLFAGFPGIFRRQEWLYRSAHLQIMTDYAHHPREVAALLDYLRKINPQGKLVAVFQPHRYTRTRQFAREFAQVLASRTDAFFLMPVYAASETAFSEGRTEAIADACLCAEADGAAGGAVGAGRQSVKVYPPHAIAAQCRQYLNFVAAGAAVASGTEIADEAAAAGDAFIEVFSDAVAPVGVTAPVAPTAVTAIDGRHADKAPVTADALTASGTPADAEARSSDAMPTGIEAPVTLVFVGAGDIDALARRVAADCALRERWQQQLGAQTVVRLGEPLARRTTMRIGGSARFYADPGSVADVSKLITLAQEAALPVWLLGRGSNLIVPDEGFNGLVISFNSDAFRRIEPQGDGNWYAGSGVALKRLCAEAARQGVSGWEFLDGIPGTVGGALRMNAGAMGLWMFDVVVAVDILLPDGTVERRPAAAFDVGYRKCAELAGGGVALGAVLRSGVRVPAQQVRSTLDSYACRRKETQPREPSAGCIFKNPEGHHAGALIDELGLKGLSVGGAEVSAVHGNFIINRGDATAADVLELVRQVRARVREARGIELEPEALLMGINWQDVL